MHERFRRRSDAPPNWPQRPWRRWQSWLLVVLVAVLDMSFAFDATTSHQVTTDHPLGRIAVTGVLWLAVVSSPVTAALLFARFARPELVAGLTLALNPLGSLAFLVAYFHLATRRITGFVLALGLVRVLLDAGYVALIVYARVRLEDVPATWQAGVTSVLLPGVLVLTVVVAIAAFRGQRRQTLVDLHDRVRQAERERESSALAARLSERHLIAREMHDVLAHRMSLVALHAGALAMQSEALRPVLPERAEKLHRSAELVREHSQLALDELRDVLGVLREDDQSRLSPPLGLADLGSLVDGWKQAGMALTLHDPQDLCRPDSPVPLVTGRHAARTIREALTNASRHAPGAAVRVELRVDGGSLSTAVVNGPRTSRPLGPGAGQGLTGIAERVELAGGRFDARATDTGGFAVRVMLPLVRPSAVPTGP